MLLFMKKKLGNGLSTLFWDDVWCDGRQALRIDSLERYALENSKQITVESKTCASSLTIRFSRTSGEGGGLELTQVEEVTKSDNPCGAYQSPDFMGLWTLNNSGGLIPWLRQETMIDRDYFRKCHGSAWVEGRDVGVNSHGQFFGFNFGPVKSSFFVAGFLDPGMGGKKNIKYGDHVAGKKNNTNDGGLNDEGTVTGGVLGQVPMFNAVNVSGIKDDPSSYANKLSPTSMTKSGLRKLGANVPNDADYDFWLPLASVHEVSDIMKNSLYGYFIGKRLAFLVMEWFARNN
ncbi:hypothetical protein Tco_0245408 [Tanacetum coccineum]